MCSRLEGGGAKGEKGSVWGIDGLSMVLAGGDDGLCL